MSERCYMYRAQLSRCLQNPQPQEILLLERPIENADNEMVMVVKPAL